MSAPFKTGGWERFFQVQKAHGASERFVVPKFQRSVTGRRARADLRDG